MMPSWFDWTFFLIVLFPLPIAIAGYSVWATWVFSRSENPAVRTIERSTSIALTGICAIGTFSSFAAWVIGFEYTESPTGVPARLERVVNAGWVLGLASLVAVVVLATGCFIRQATRTPDGQSRALPAHYL